MTYDPEPQRPSIQPWPQAPVSGSASSPQPYETFGHPNPYQEQPVNPYGSPKASGAYVPEPTVYPSGTRPVAYQPPPYQPQPYRQQSGLAIASLVTSLMGMGIIGIVLGHMALSEIKRDGKDGSGFAIAGLAIGYVSVLAVVAVIGFTALIVAGNT